MSGLGAGAARTVSDYIRAELAEVEPVGSGRLLGRAPVTPHLRNAAGGMRTGALLTLIDFAGGFAAGLASLPTGWVVTTSLHARLVAVAHVGPLRVDAEVARAGRASVVTPVMVRDEGAGEAVVARAVLTSAVLVPEGGPPQWERPARITVGTGSADPPPMPEWLGARVVGPDALEIGLEDRLRNPWGILHGGVVAMLVDLAAEHATGGITTDVVLHYLAPNRTGPVRAEVRPLVRRSDGTVCRVEVTDTAADRVTAVAITTSAPAPPPRP